MYNVSHSKSLVANKTVTQLSRTHNTVQKKTKQNLSTDKDMTEEEPKLSLNTCIKNSKQTRYKEHKAWINGRVLEQGKTVISRDANEGGTNS